MDQPKVIIYSGYYINGIHFAIREQDKKCCTQNSGVSMVARTHKFQARKTKSQLLGICLSMK